MRPRLGLRAAVRVAGATAAATGGGAAGGRWSLLPGRELDPTIRAHALAAQLLDRHGVLTRAIAPSEGLGGRFGDVYRVLTALEQGGQVRRGYFVERLGGSQFALPGAVDRLRIDAQVVDAAAERVADGLEHGPAAHVVVLAATDPANPYGAALAWPDPPRERAAEGARHRPGRKAGGLVVLVDGALVLYLERGGRTALSFTDADDALVAAASALAETVRSRHVGRLTIHRIDGAEVLAGGALHGAVGRALVAAGFATTPRGLRLGGS